MSLVYSSNLPAGQRQTHALVIGVGDYPHLRGGTLFQTQPASVTFGLGQLTSSVVSAQEFANWLRTSLSNPTAPLGSVELLLSPTAYQPPGAAPSEKVDAASMQNIKTAFTSWYGRSNANKDNVAIFYYSGHGMESEIMVLLPEDFGASPLNPWDNAIDFTATWYGMAECAAKTQCYFLDACREKSIDLLKTSKVDAHALKTTQLVTFPERDGYVLKAAPMGRQAHGPPSGVSYFTEALIACLKGVGASHKAGSKWIITTDSLTGAAVRYMKRMKIPGAPKVACSKGGDSNFTTDIHELNDPALVMASIECNPSTALSTAQLAAASASNPAKVRGPGSADAWDVELETGQWDISAQFPGGGYKNATQQGLLAYPPFFPCKLDV